MFALLLCVSLSRGSLSQRYHERHVIPADAFPSSVTADYDYYAEGFGFEEKEADVYKWMVDEFPHPRNNSRFCNRLRPSNVCDPDAILSKENADSLDEVIRQLYKGTPCICPRCDEGSGGIVVGIALFKHMYQPYNVHPVKAIKAFAESLRKNWKLGQCDNDILIVVATTDRLSYTDVGESTATYLSLPEAHRIFVSKKASFTAGDFFEGLRDILDGYQQATRDTMAEVGRKKELDVAVISGIIIGSILAFGLVLFVGFVVYRRCKLRKSEVDSYSKSDMDSMPSRGWTKKDIKVIFGSEKRKNLPPLKTKYEPCEVEEQSPAEVMDFRLATPADTSFQNDTQMSDVPSGAEILENDLTKAAENIVRTFPSTNKSSVLITDI